MQRIITAKELCEIKRERKNRYITEGVQKCLMTIINGLKYSNSINITTYYSNISGTDDRDNMYFKDEKVREIVINRLKELGYSIKISSEVIVENSTELKPIPIIGVFGFKKLVYSKKSVQYLLYTIEACCGEV